MTIDQMIEVKVRDYAKAAVLEERDKIVSEALKNLMTFNVTVKKFSEIVGKNKQSVYNKIVDGSLPHRMEGGTYIIDIKEAREQVYKIGFHHADEVISRIDQYIENEINSKLWHHRQNKS